MMPSKHTRHIVQDEYNSSNIPCSAHTRPSRSDEPLGPATIVIATPAVTAAGLDERERQALIRGKYRLADLQNKAITTNQELAWLCFLHGVRMHGKVKNRDRLIRGLRTVTMDKTTKAYRLRYLRSQGAVVSEYASNEELLSRIKMLWSNLSHEAGSDLTDIGRCAVGATFGSEDDDTVTASDRDEGDLGFDRLRSRDGVRSDTTPARTPSPGPEFDVTVAVSRDTFVQFCQEHEQEIEIIRGIQEHLSIILQPMQQRKVWLETHHHSLFQHNHDSGL